MNTINMPGFTAEASLYNGIVRYQSTTMAAFYGGIVQPAGPFSDVVSDPSGSSFPHIFPRGWGNCLKRVCIPHFHPLLPWPVCEYIWVSAIC